MSSGAPPEPGTRGAQAMHVCTASVLVQLLLVVAVAGMVDKIPDTCARRARHGPESTGLR